MTEAEISQARSEYQIIKKENDTKDSLLTELDQLEENKEVQKYVQILEKLHISPTFGNILLSEEDMAEQAFDVIANSTFGSNEIYVYIGETIKLHPKDSCTDDCTSYKTYKDLETTREVSIHYSEIANFEATHNVINPEVNNKMNFYNNLRRKFLLQLITKPQDEVVRKLLKEENNY